MTVPQIYISRIKGTWQRLRNVMQTQQQITFDRGSDRFSGKAILRPLECIWAPPEES